jgi:hypothetical protein
VYRFLRWLEAASHRGVILNILMLAVLLAMIADPGLYVSVGSVCLAAGAWYGLRRAVGASTTIGRDSRPRLILDRMAIWMPGAAALALAGLGLVLAASQPAGSSLQIVGAALFAYELVMLALPGSGPARLMRARA